MKVREIKGFQNYIPTQYWISLSQGLKETFQAEYSGGKQLSRSQYLGYVCGYTMWLEP